MENGWCVYVLECKDGSFYTGVTNDIGGRMKKHASRKGSKYVARKGFGRLLKVKSCKNKSDACKKEYWIKHLPRSEKLRAFD
jgi:putative endonuclease